VASTLWDVVCKKKGGGKEPRKVQKKNLELRLKNKKSRIIKYKRGKNKQRPAETARKGGNFQKGENRICMRKNATHPMILEGMRGSCHFHKKEPGGGF